MSRLRHIMLLAVALTVAMTTVVQVGGGGRTARAADGTITGTVYQDFNSNGANDTEVKVGQAADIGIAGVTVRAFDAAGAQVGEATSGSDGTYSLSVTGASSAAIRVEFILPTTGPLSAMQPSFVGTQNGTTVRFVKTLATDVDMGYNVPGEFCQNNPNLSISRLCAGSSVAINGSPSAWVTQYDGGPFTVVGSQTKVFNSWSLTSVATKSTTGAILGMTWDPGSRRVYHTAYVRRHAEMYESSGTPRPGALFVTNPTGTTAAQGVGGTTQFLVDLESLLAGDQFSNSNSAGPGYIPTNAARKLQYMVDGTGDGGAENDGVDSDLVTGQDGVFEEVGKTGIGDIETDGRGNLWVVSLYDKNLYQVTLPASGAPTQMTSLGSITSGVACTNGQARPFSVKLWRGSLYLGVVCDGSADFDPTNSLAIKNANLSFVVRKYDLATSTMSNFFGPHPLNASGNIKKGEPYTEWGMGNPIRTVWNPWIDTFDTSTANYDAAYKMRPEPMLTEIEFDRDGSMILGFRDRHSDQMSTFQSEAPDGSSQGDVFGAGDIYRVCRTGSGYSASDYVFEGGTGCGQTTRPAGRPEFGLEYYSGDHWLFQRNSTSPIEGHAETSLGMTEQVPGFPDLILNSYDPMSGNADGFYAGGPRWFLNSTGGPADFPNEGSGVMFYTHTFTATNPNTLGGFMKTNGMSDVEALCDQAPLQIGNRVWIDTDLDGIQDPDETAVPGVTVRLYNSSGTLVGTAITDAQGQYYFSSNLSEAAAGNGDSTGGGLAPDAGFTIKLDNATDYASGGALNGYVLTATNSTTAVTTDTDNSIDNDASLVGGSTYGVNKFPAISVDPHGPGMNDHTFDFGFHLLIKVSVGDYVWWDFDRDGLQDANEAPIPGVTLSIKKADGSAVVDVDGNPVTTTTTDANGKYSFDNLPPGQYTVTVTPPAGAIATLANAGTNTAVDSSTGSATSRNMTTDGDRDPTLDFGFYMPSVSVGDYVWWDINRDGVQGADELPIAGVTLTIKKADGSAVTDVFGKPVSTTKSDAAGKYSFDNLPVGQYVVTVTPPAGATATLANVGSYVAVDSSTGSATSRDMPTDGDRDPTLDFGFYKPSVSVGNRVWLDNNGDGIQGPEDTGLPGFKLTVLSANGKPVTDVYGRPVAPIVTGPDGSYSFDLLPPGQYQVQITYPKDYLPTKEGRSKGLNSWTLVARSKVLAAGQSDVGLNFGLLYRPGEVYEQVLPATL